MYVIRKFQLKSELTIAAAFVVLICDFTRASPLAVKPRRAIPTTRPVVIAHRGASGVLPEHTVEGYRRAVDDMSDYVECDVTLTRDLIPVCLHENSLSRTTDVADHPEFADRRRTITYLDTVSIG